MDEIEAMRAEVRKIKRLTRILLVAVGVSFVPWLFGGAKVPLPPELL